MLVGGMDNGGVEILLTGCVVSVDIPWCIVHTTFTSCGDQVENGPLPGRPRQGVPVHKLFVGRVLSVDNGPLTWIPPFITCAGGVTENGGRWVVHRW